MLYYLILINGVDIKGIKLKLIHKAVISLSLNDVILPKLKFLTGISRGSSAKWNTDSFMQFLGWNKLPILEKQGELLKNLIYKAFHERL